MKRYIFGLFVILLFSIQSFLLKAAEQKDSTSFFSARLGYSIGGTTPMPLPAEIRKINGYSPLFNYSVGAFYNYRLNSNWFLVSGIRLERKGMTSKATVKNYGMSIKNDDGSSVSGRWTGDVTMTSDQVSLTVPLSVFFSISEKWRLQAGLYASYVLSCDFSGEVYDGYLREGDPTGAKIEIDDKGQSFDFSDEMQKFQWGASIGTEYRVCKSISVFADLNWGLNNIFESDFKTVTFNLYPIYGNIGVEYAFK